MCGSRAPRASLTPSVTPATGGVPTATSTELSQHARYMQQKRVGLLVGALGVFLNCSQHVPRGRSRPQVPRVTLNAGGLGCDGRYGVWLLAIFASSKSTTTLWVSPSEPKTRTGLSPSVSSHTVHRTPSRGSVHWRSEIPPKVFEIRSRNEILRSGGGYE